VEKLPPQSQSVPRVAAALGAVGHLSLLALAQNLVVLWLISRVASPALAAFCGFVAMSLIIDLGFFFTFFVAMLSLDSRKYGLQDTFEEARQRYEDEESTEAALVSGLAQQQRRDIKQRPKHAALPYPRVSGTVAALSFLFILGWHFFDGKTTSHGAPYSAVLFDGSEFRTARDYRHEFNATLEQTRDSVGWLEMQDHETLNEILCMANPRSNGLLARVYDPLIIVLKSADRTPSPAEGTRTLSQIHTIISSPLSPSVFLFCCVVALTLTLWNWSFSNDTLDETGNRIIKPGTLSSVQCLPRGHKLDVFILGASPKRVLASVGFDHEIRVWNLESRIIGSQFVPASQGHKLWPVVAIAIDGKAEWLAICSKSGEVSFWNIRLQSFGRSTTINLNSHIVACFFTPSSHHYGLHLATRFLIVGAAGRLTDIDVETANVMSHQICVNGVQSSHVNSHRRMPLRLITIGEDNRIYVTARRENCWTSQAVDFSVPVLSQPSRLRFTIIPDLRMVALVLNIDTCQLYLIDLLSG
jgi:WD40 repeat protein